MDHGEINLSGAKQLANALKTKKVLKICDLNGNQFGEEGCKELKKIFSGMEVQSILQSLRYFVNQINPWVWFLLKRCFIVMTRVNLVVMKRKVKGKNLRVITKKKKRKKNQKMLWKMSRPSMPCNC